MYLRLRHCFRFRLALLIHLTLAFDIRLESLDDGPGLLPFKLGQTKLITHYHSFIQYIELSDLEHQLDSIKDQLDYFKTKLDNNTLSIFELQIDYLNSKILKVTSQLKSLEPNRVKRGLFNGLGSFIKGITGNLDYSDAEKYDKAIRILENNEEKMLSELNDHISLNKAWATQYTKIISNLIENQQKINDTFKLIIDKRNFSEIKFAKFAQLLAIISENTDDLYLEINRIENILAFIRASSTHHSMISIDNLENMILRLRNIYSNNEILDADLRDYYNIIKPGSYFIKKRIVVIFKIPIVSVDTFELYRLSVVPNKLQQTFIPPYPFMATYGKSFMYMEAECPKFGDYLLCEDTINHQPREQPDCIQSIITNQSLNKSCRPTKITFTKEAMEQLDDRHYTLIFPSPTKVELHCVRQEYVILSGSYLITIPLKCSLRTKTITIMNINDEIKGQPLKIIEIANNYSTIEDEKIPHLTLNTVNLKNLQHLEDKIIVQNPIKLDHVEASLYHTTIPLYGITVCTVTIILVMVIRRYLKRIRAKVTVTEEESRKDKKQMYAMPSESSSQESVPATFSLKVLK